MSTLLMAGILFGWAGCSALSMKKRFEQQLPFAAGIIIAVLYAAGLFGELTAGLYLIFAGTAVAFLTLIVLLSLRRSEHLFRYLFTPGMAAFLAAVFWLLVGFRGYMFSGWDDFSHWGLAVKNMYIYSALPAGVSQATISYTDYPPASTLFSWLWTLLSGVFNEEDPQRALNMLMLCFLLPAMKDQDWRKPGKALSMAVLLFGFPLLFSTSAYRTLQVDTLIGCVSLYVLYAWFLCRHDVCTYTGIGISLFLLPLIKEMGFAFALLLIVIIGADMFLDSKRQGKRCVIVIGLFVMAVAAASVSWRSYLQLYQVAEVWNKNKISLDVIGQMLLGQANTDYYAIARSFINALCAPDLWQMPPSAQISFVCWLLLAFAVTQALLRTAGEQDKRLKRMYRLLFAGLLVYLCVLLCIYLFLFRLDEALNVNSLERYLASYLLPLIGFTVLLAVYRLDDKLSNVGVHAPLCGLICMLFTISPQTVLQQALVMKEQNTVVYEQRMQELIPISTYEYLDQKSDRVYYVAVQDNGEKYYRAAYQFTPIPIQDGMWSAWPVAIKKDDWHDKTAIAFTPDAWMQLLKTDGFTHVYLDTVDERFKKDYASLFESESAICSGQLYRVTHNETGTVLTAVQ